MIVYLFHSGRAWMVFLPNGQTAKVWWRQSQNINWRPQVGFYWAHEKWDHSFMVDNPYMAPKETPRAENKGLLNKALDLLGLQRKAS